MTDLSAQVSDNKRLQDWLVNSNTSFKRHRFSIDLSGVKETTPGFTLKICTGNTQGFALETFFQGPCKPFFVESNEWVIS